MYLANAETHGFICKAIQIFKEKMLFLCNLLRSIGETGNNLKPTFQPSLLDWGFSDTHNTQWNGMKEDFIP